VSFCIKFIVLLFDEEKAVKNKDDLQEWFKIGKNVLFKNVNEFKDKLKQRIKEEAITKRQYDKIAKIYEVDKFETSFYESVSAACVKLAGWVRAMRSVYLTNEILAPIVAKLNEAQAQLKEGQDLLDRLNAEKDECIRKCNALQADADECQRKKVETENNLQLNKLRLIRANKLLSGLADEKKRWEEEVKRLRYEGQFLIGNSLVAAGMMSYGGAFYTKYRLAMTDIWIPKIKEYNIPLSEPVNLINVVGNRVEFEKWKGQYNLPDDDLSKENAIILKNTKRWPLCIDPQNQANSFIRKMGLDVKKQLFKVMKASEDKISNELELSIKIGKWLMIENVNEKLSPELEPILVPQIKIKGRLKTIKFGEKEIDYSEDFRFFMTTTIPNPH